MEREKLTQSEVLDWLLQNHPELHKKAELDRSWIWLVVDLRGDDLKPVRESIKEFGFIFSRRGGHPLPSGNIGTWGHSCNKPIAFKRGKKQARKKSQAAAPAPNKPQQSMRVDPFEIAAAHEERLDNDLAEAAAFFNV